MSDDVSYETSVKNVLSWFFGQRLSQEYYIVFWLIPLIIFSASMFLLVEADVLHVVIAEFLVFMLCGVFIIPHILISIWRLNDIGMSGYFAALGFLPFANVLLTIALVALPSDFISWANISRRLGRSEMADLVSPLVQYSGGPPSNQFSDEDRERAARFARSLSLLRQQKLIAAFFSTVVFAGVIALFFREILILYNVFGFGFDEWPSRWGGSFVLWFYSPPFLPFLFLFEEFWTPVITILALITPLFALWWTIKSVWAIFTPARFNLLWLRRFHRGTHRFSHRTIDKLGAKGFTSLTLEDSSVRFSRERRAHSRPLFFWLVFGPLYFLFLFVQRRMFEAASAEYETYVPSGYPDDPFLLTSLQAIGLGAITVSLAVVASACIIYLFNKLLTLTRRRSDTGKRLQKVLSRYSGVRRPRGSMVVKVGDANWKKVVERCIAESDFVCIDLSEVNDSMEWELAAVARLLHASRTICLLDRRIVADAKKFNQVKNLLAEHFGSESPHIFVYGENRHGVGRFSVLELNRLHRLLVGRVKSIASQRGVRAAER